MKMCGYRREKKLKSNLLDVLMVLILISAIAGLGYTAIMLSVTLCNWIR